MTHILRHDTHARIPFAILGVLLLLASSLTTALILHLHTTTSEPLTQPLNLNAATRLTQAAEADLATALNRAATHALIDIGRHPITTPYNSTTQDLLYQRLSHAITPDLAVYLLAHYTDNQYTDGTYTLNTPLTNDTVTLNPDTITFTTRTLTLHRTTLPYLGPPPIITPPTYLLATLPLTLNLTTLNHPTTPTPRHLTITTLITSRYPLLEALTNEYQTTINGTLTPLWTYTTTTTTLYTMIRTWKHYHQGQPANIVDNHHLTLLTNAGLLLQQTQTFHTIDPLTITSLLAHTRHTLTQPTDTDLTLFNTQTNTTGTTYPTHNITTTTANLDAGDPLTTPITTTPLLTLHDIAHTILSNTTGITLTFTQPPNQTDTQTIPYTNHTTRDITTLITSRHDHGWTLTNITTHTTRNDTTDHTIQTITAAIYHATMYTLVTNRTQTTLHIDPPGPPWHDGPTGSWTDTLTQPESKQLIKPPKGHIHTGSPLYQETYNVTYQRTHSYYQDIDLNHSGNHTTLRLWDNRTDTQTETVILHTILHHAATYNDTSDDITDLLYDNTTLHDPNLNDTLTTYLSQHPDTQPEKQDLITTLNNTGTTGLNTDVLGTIPAWVYTTIWGAFDDIDTTLTNLPIDPACNATHYPYPPTLLSHILDNLTALLATHPPEILAFDDYHPGPTFLSVGMKTVYAARAWLLDIINTSLHTTITTLITNISQTIDNAIPAASGYTAHSIQDVLTNTTDALRDKFTIPFGTPMTLTNIQQPTWTEPVLLALDQTPHYLDPYQPLTDGHEQLWTLKLRNRCLFGPTGLPILPPTPVTPWILTMNLWAIDVEGEYLRFELLDANNEAAFTPLIGHAPQPYIREAAVITNGTTPLGENTRIHFAYSTLSCAIVPAFGMMCGDFQDNWANDATPGYLS
jgi:hypothetical protein